MTGDSGSGPIRKKLINRGWGAPTVEEFRDNIKAIEASPFDGVAIRFYVKDDEGKTVRAFGAGMNRPWKKDWFQPAIDILKGVNSEVRAESFFSLSLAVPPSDFADAFDDEGWKNVTEHFRIAAWVAKEAGLKGLMMDLEAYSSTVLKYAARTQKEKTFDEYAAKVRQRGREMMEAMAGEYPDMTVFTLFLNSGPAMAAFGGDPRQTLANEKNYYNLMPAFINGWLDAIPPGMTVVDGMEHAYPHTSEIAYLRRVNAARNSAIAFVAKENQVKFRAQVQAGLAIFMDAFIIPQLDVHADVYADPPLDGKPLVDRLRSATMTALDVADEYVWVFDERYRFWPTSNSSVEPIYWDEFIPGASEALKQAKNPSLRELANAEREFQIGEDKAEIRGTPRRNLLADGNVLPTPKKAPDTKSPWEPQSPGGGTLEFSKMGRLDPGSLGLKATTDGSWSQSVPVTSNTFYKARVGVRQIGQGKPEMCLLWRDESGQEIGRATARPTASPNEAWVPIDTIVKAPPGAATLLFQLVASGQKSEHDQIWYDNAELYRIGVN